MDRVVPFAMESVGLQVDMGKLFIRDLASNGVLAVIQAAGHFQALGRRRPGDQPRQLEEMKENKRCSTLFHLLVPGGKWQTVSVSPVWSAKRCNSHFHSRRRQPLLPPPSAVISSRRARTYRRRPSARHQPRIEA